MVGALPPSLEANFGVYVLEGLGVCREDARW